MHTNIVLDEQLTIEALALTGINTKQELINFALAELVKSKRKPNEESICDAFETLHQLALDDDPFPDSKRENR